MQPSEKSGEPSMEDILASIRKIIAEDPSALPANGTGALPLPATPAPSTSPVFGIAQSAPNPGPPPAARPQSPPQTTQSHPTMSSLERELADLLREPVAFPPAARAAPAPSAPLTVPSQGAIPVAAPAKSAPANATPSNGSGSGGTSGLTAWLRGKPKADPPPPEPEITPFPPEPAATRDDAISALISAPPAPQSPPEPPPAAPASASTPMIAPGIAKLPEGKTAAAAPAAAPVSMQAILERLNAPTPPAGAAPVKTQPLPAAVKSRTFNASPSVSARAMETSDVAVAPGNRPLVEPTVPDSAPAAQASSVPSPMQAPSPPAALPARGVDAPAMEQADEAIGSSAEAAAPPTVAAAPERSPTPRPAAVEATPPVPAANTAAPSDPPASLPGPVLPAPGLPAPVLPVPVLPVPVLDDLLAEMLRPMVRQWLDDNMRSALEKAVRAETSAALKPADKT